jgi:hypothetical protein
MAIPSFLEFAKMQTGRSQQQDPMSGIIGSLEEVVRGKREKEQAAAAKQYGEARLEEQQLKADKQRQDIEHERLLAPHKRALVKAQAEKLKVPLEHLSQMNYYKQHAEQTGDKETAKLLQGMMHNYAASEHLQGDARQIQGLMSLKDQLKAQGQNEQVDEIDKVIKEKLTPKGKVLGELEKGELKNFAEYEKNTSENASTAEDAIKKVDRIVHLYDKTGDMFKGGMVAPGTKIGDFLAKQAPRWDDYFPEMIKEIGNLQKNDLAKLRSGGRLTVALQGLVASSTLSPSLGKAAMQRMSTELKSGMMLLKEKARFLEEAKKRGITNQLEINNSWNKYMEENPAYSLKEVKGSFGQFAREEGVINEDALSKKTWGKYLPGTEGTTAAPESYTDAEIDFTAQKRGISREEVIKRLKAAGKM